MAQYIITDTESQIERITKKCNDLAESIEKSKEEILEELLRYESFDTATDEISRSIDCLRNISKELKYLSYGKVSLICTFFPVNLPLYSLIIFAVVPSFMSDEVVIRPPKLMFDVVQNICNRIQFSKLLPHIKFVDLERGLFNEIYVSIADVILFTGRYENAKIVQDVCPDALFIYNGAGINPVLVTDSADIDLAVQKTIEMRVFNSGQDCAGSDAILIHEKIAKEFSRKLILGLKKIKVGDYSNREVKIGKLVKLDLISEIYKFFANHEYGIVFGGNIDKEKGIVYPTVIEDDIRNINKITYTEFFAPIFYLLIYHDENDLNRYFSEIYAESAMYVSLFDKSLKDYNFPNSKILLNQIVNDVEKGNDPYGGYGPKANFSTYYGIYNYRPLLISYEIFNYLKEVNSKLQ